MWHIALCLLCWHAWLESEPAWHDMYQQHICDQICEKGSYSLFNWMHLTVHCVTCEHGTNLKFGDCTLLTWFYSWEKFYINRLNTLWGATNWSWKLRKAIRPLFSDPVTYTISHVQMQQGWIKTVLCTCTVTHC